MRCLFFVLAAVWLVPYAWADSVYKCFDATGRVIYQSQSCASAHLKDGGQIESPTGVPPEEVERIRAETEKTRVRLETKKKADEEAEAKARQRELEERKVQALERQAQAAEEQARVAEEGARMPKLIVVPTRPQVVKPRPPHPSQRCAPGDRSCK
jgi:hypothetical protein